MKIGRYIKQPQGYKAFVLEKFPPVEGFDFSPGIIQKANSATFKLGKLDGIAQLLPDLEFYLFMYIRKDAASSSQIEGTQATMIDAIAAESNSSHDLPADVDDILKYIHALNYGIKRLKEFPLSLRLIREIHHELMKDGRSTHYSAPGEFRTSQNWIGGTMPGNAQYVPPPPHEMTASLDDLEKFLHKRDNLLPVIKAGLIHAQFEAIHPFLDGNGRTGRMLITLYLQIEKLLESPILFLSWYFKKNQKTYYQRLAEYYESSQEKWIDFFLDGVIETADESIETIRKITVLREKDILKIQSLNKSASESAIKVLPKLFQMPIVDVNQIVQWTGFSRQGAQKVIDRFVELDILKQLNENQNYGRSFIYKQYLDIFK
ncbi:MAG: Fic family protein [Ignavibacteriaceae bacterium]|nr:Fic family protein [Ignavibacteriaceae bacterium]